jgi:hypothetical protein
MNTRLRSLQTKRYVYPGWEYHHDEISNITRLLTHKPVVAYAWSGAYPFAK